MKYLFSIFLSLIVLASEAKELTSFDFDIPSVGKFRECISQINCTPTQNCNSFYKKKRDTRNCKKCIMKNPLGANCIAYSNDPYCETAKAAQNAAYQFAEATAKLDCERAKVSGRIQCESKKIHELAICESKKKDEIAAAQGLTQELLKYIELSKGKKFSQVNDSVSEYMKIHLDLSNLHELNFYNVANGENVIDRGLMYFSPDVFINRKSIPNLGLLQSGHVLFVKNFVYVPRSHDLIVEDAIRASIFMSFYRLLGIDGVAQISTSSSFGLKEQVENRATRLCDRLYNLRVEFSCADRLELH